jgi:hypothetical protein
MPPKIPNAATKKAADKAAGKAAGMVGVKAPFSKPRKAPTVNQKP